MAFFEYNTEEYNQPESGTGSLATLIGRPICNVFRRLEIKRRQSSDGKFEPDWQDKSEFVKSWGEFEAAVDDVRLNRFTHSGLSVVMRNDAGTFNPETSGNSFWSGYLTRYRSLVRISAGYFDADGNELPSTSTQGIYVLSDEIPISGVTQEATLNCKSLVSVFDEVRAVDVAGLGATLTASQIIAVIRDHTDGSSNFIFREFVTSTSWVIEDTTNFYNLATSGSLANMTCWELMTKVAEAEGFVILANRFGEIEFRSRDERSSTSTFDLFGQGFPEMNVISVDEIKEPWNRLYNFFRLKYLDDDTATSYVTAGTTTAIDPANRSWKYGQRVYTFENDFFNTATAQSVVNSLFTTVGFGSAPQDVAMTCKFLPQVEVLDRVSVNHHSFSMVGTTLWDFFDWDGADWDFELGENINWTDKAFKIIGKRTNLDDFTTILRLQELM